MWANGECALHNSNLGYQVVGHTTARFKNLRRAIDLVVDLGREQRMNKARDDSGRIEQGKRLK
jgi:ribosomal protein L17